MTVAITKVTTISLFLATKVLYVSVHGNKEYQT